MDNKIFIDDWRKPSRKHPDGDAWILCESYDDFEQVVKALIEKKETISEISFDFDLQDRNHNGADCYKLLARCIMDDKTLPVPNKIYIHSEFPNAEEFFRGVSMSLEHHLDIDIKMIKIDEFGQHSIIKTWGE